MLIAKKTLYRGCDGDYPVRYRTSVRKRDWDWFLCGNWLWDTFPLSGPAPNAIRIELHDVPAKNRVEIMDTLGRNQACFDGKSRFIYHTGYCWLKPFLRKHGTIFAEVWY